MQIINENSTINWDDAINTNRIALARIVAELLAMIGVASGQTFQRILRSAESAVRRLIVIAARGLVISTPIKRPPPHGFKFERKGEGHLAFKLFDARKKFEFNSAENQHIVMVQTYSNNPFNLFESFSPSHIEKAKLSNLQLGQRLNALAKALGSIPQQARRLARWKARRKSLHNPKYTSPLRPGPPPGFQAKSNNEVDYILKDCHFFAWEALKLDSS
jgi:hypothetical protein